MMNSGKARSRQRKPSVTVEVDIETVLLPGLQDTTTVFGFEYASLHKHLHRVFQIAECERTARGYARQTTEG